MSKLLLIRHGQASAGSVDYDQLSPLGYEQAAKLGAHWVQYKQPLDRVYVGTLKRHHQTLDGVAAAYKSAGQHWPTPEESAAFDEYDAVKLLQQAVPSLIAQDDVLRKELEAATADGTSMFAGPLFWKLFVTVTRMWARGELDPSILPWTDFQAQVKAGVDALVATDQGSETVAVFTSGGPISVAVGLSMGLDPVATLELSWRIYNASLTSFLFKDGQISLSQMNTIPHLPHTDDQTHR